MVSVVALQTVALVLVGLGLALLAVVQARAAEQNCGSPSVAQGPHHMHGGGMGVVRVGERAGQHYRVPLGRPHLSWCFHQPAVIVFGYSWRKMFIKLENFQAK